MTDKGSTDKGKARREAEAGKARSAPSGSRPAKKRSIRMAVAWPGLLALVLAIIAVVVAGLLWQQVQDLRRAGEHAKDIERRFTTLDGRLQSHLVEQQRLTRRLQSLDRAVAALPDMRRSLNRLHKTLARDHQAWVLAEVRYLIHLAGQRLQLAGDIDTALTALQAADARLRRLGRASLLSLRRYLATDIQALKGLPRVDISGMAVRLDSAIEQVAQLPLRRVRQSSRSDPQDTGKTGQGDVLARIWGSLRSLVVIRRHDRRIEPLLDQAQEQLIRQVLLLRLEQARTALLRRDTGALRQALTRSRAWLEAHFDSHRKPVSSLQQLLDEMARAELRPRLPLPLQSSRWQPSGPATSDHKGKPQ